MTLDDLELGDLVGHWQPVGSAFLATAGLLVYLRAVLDRDDSLRVPYPWLYRKGLRVLRENRILSCSLQLFWIFLLQFYFNVNVRAL